MNSGDIFYSYYEPGPSPIKGEIEGINILLQILYPSLKLVKAEAIRRCARDCIIILAKYGPQIVGMARLVIIPSFIGESGKIEDVVVHPEYRGIGIGTQMLVQLTNRAQRMGLNKLELTSNPKRIAAIRLYTSHGFRKIDTNVYVLNL